MRIVAVLACCVAAAAADLGCGVRPADAQTIVQRFFGASVASPRYVLRRPGSARFFGYSRPYGRGAYDSQSYRSYADDELGYMQPERRYQTLCVRMCDGYYWPISAATTRAGMYADAQQCAASCDADVTLFYRANDGVGGEAMIDLTGRSYARLPNAFRYRKSLVEGCMCRPVPWAASEVSRHRRYAADEARGAGDWRRADVNAEPVAGIYDTRERKVPVADSDDLPSAAELEAAAVNVPDASEAVTTYGVYQNPPLRWNARPRVRYIPAPRYAWPGDMRRR